MTPRQPIDNLDQRTPDPKEAFAESWGGRLDEYQAKVQQIKLKAGQSGSPASAEELERMIEAVRSCVDDVARTADQSWMKKTEPCEQQWREFEEAFHKAEAQVGGIPDEPHADAASENDACRGHGGQPGHQTTRQCPP